LDHFGAKSAPKAPFSVLERFDRSGRSNSSVIYLRGMHLQKVDISLKIKNKTFAKNRFFEKVSILRSTGHIWRSGIAKTRLEHF